MKTPLWIALSALSGAALLACNDLDPDDGADATAHVEQAILGGTADNTQPAVVALIGEGLCTGTLFKVDRTQDVAYVLTAAHCVSPVPEYAVFAPDFTAENAMWVRVADAIPDPRYAQTDESEYDLALVRLQGLPRNLPEPIPLTGSADGLAAGRNVVSYGFGSTTRYDDPNNDNSKRNRIEKAVSVVRQRTFEYNQRDRTGICAGDSGGPSIYNGKVVGVHSAVAGVSQNSEPCHGDAIVTRLAGGQDFMQQALALAPPTPMPACDRCLGNADYDSSVCQARRDTCLGDSKCRAVAECMSNARTNSAQSACLKSSAAGAYLAYAACGCTDACTSECSGQSACADMPRCGFVDLGDDGCGEAQCCSEFAAASADLVGYGCLVDGESASCSSNSAYQAASRCYTNKCASSSGSSSGGGATPGDDPSDGSGDGSTDGDGNGGTTTVTKSGCHAGAELGGQASWLVGLLGVLALRRRRQRA